MSGPYYIPENYILTNYPVFYVVDLLAGSFWLLRRKERIPQLPNSNIEESSGRTYSWCMGIFLWMHQAPPARSLQNGVSTILPAEPTADGFDKSWKKNHTFSYPPHTPGMLALCSSAHLHAVHYIHIIFRHIGTSTHTYNSLFTHPQAASQISNDISWSCLVGVCHLPPSILFRWKAGRPVLCWRRLTAVPQR